MTLPPTSDDVSAAAPPLRVLLAVGEPERERRLLDGLVGDGIVVAGRCLDAGSLTAVAPGETEVILASSALHRLTPATLLAVREAGLPLVLLADPESLIQYQELAYLLPLETPVLDVRAALVAAAGRGPKRDRRASASAGEASAPGPEVEASGHVIALTGGKGAPGVTTLAVALAGALADRGRDVLLVDADLRLGGVGPHLDLDPRRGLFTLAYGPRAGRDDWPGRLEEEVQEGPGFAVLGGIERAAQRDQIGTEIVLALLDAARRRYQDVVVDAGPTLHGLTPAGSEAALRRAEQVLLVAVPDLPGLWHARAACTTLREVFGVSDERLGLVLNRRASREHYAAAEVERALGLPVLGVVPNDPKLVRRALAAQTPLTRIGRRGAGQPVRTLAATLLGEAATITNAGRERRIWLPVWRRA